MKFEEKISGTKVTDFKITPIFKSQFVSLADVMALDLKQETMDLILDTLRFSRGERTEDNKDACIWWCVMDWDFIMKLSCLEHYPKYVEEFKNYFGENWVKHYIRFNH
ncbi:MAG: hypothetical protein LIR50_14620 [Bacillota bacterium]|nr:hypothetical protein [Bacillota bacterium]